MNNSLLVKSDMNPNNINLNQLNINSGGSINSNITNNVEPDQQTVMDDIVTLIEQDIPECQQNLKDNHENLKRVAEYCDTNYFRSNNRIGALEETKNYTTQSLASVAYQITSLAFNILHLLDLQTTQIVSLESHVSHLSQADQIHREKIARREIGLYTANKRPSRLPKITYPANPERPQKYVRKPIDYSILDDVGHGGVKLPPSQQPNNNTLHTSRTRSISSAQSVNGGSSVYAPCQSVSGASSSSIQAPSTKPPTPPQAIRSVGSLSRASKEYRNPALSIAPPQVPSNYAPNYPMNQNSSSSLKQVNNINNKQAPQQIQGHYGAVQPMNNQQIQNIQMQQQQQHQQISAQQYKVGMVQPTMSKPTTGPGFNVYSTGTLRYGQSSNLTGPSSFEKVESNPDWAPKNYIEKVIAIYDYSKSKPDELNLCENAIIYVTKKNEDGWYEGVLDGEEGLFPCNYVEPLRDY